MFSLISLVSHLVMTELYYMYLSCDPWLCGVTG